MCEAMIATARPGVGEHELYAAAIDACFRAGATQHWMIIVCAHDGESVAWGPPAWTYRPQRPDVLREGDVVMAELFPVYGMLESQQQLAIAIGQVHADVERAASVARRSYEVGLAALGTATTYG
jgi:Xaa-Pro dipeptidase